MVKIICVMKAFYKKLNYSLDILKSLKIKDSYNEISKCDVLLARHDADCAYTYKGKAYSQILDSFSDLCKENALSTQIIAKSYSQKVNFKAFNSPFSMNRKVFLVTFMALILTFLGLRKQSTSLKKSLLTKLWVTILEKSSPKFVVAIQPCIYLCMASRKLNIKVYDFQHGVISSDHPWYGARFRHDTPTNELPTGFLCWNSSSAEVINEWSLPKNIDVVVVGNPWFQRFVNFRERDELVSNYVNTQSIFKTAKPTILFSLQWGLDKFYHDNDFNGILHRNIETFIIESADRYNWMIRLHPVQLRGNNKDRIVSYLEKTFGDLLDSVNWHESSNLPLPVVLKNINLHITDFSSIIIESSWYNTPSAILNPEVCDGGRLHSYYLDERKKGIAEVVFNDTKSIAHWVSKTLDKNIIPVDIAKESIFNTENLIEFIREFKS